MHFGPVRTAFAVALFAAVAGSAQADTEKTPRCLFVSSYHQGYAWSDNVERGLRAVLDGHCEIRQFDMDTKRRKSEEEKRRRGEMAREIIESWQPDVVVTADDNAAKYLIVPYYKDHDIPFVFCGVNWTVEEYGFPYDNVTGMIEVAPIKPLLERAQEIVPNARRVFYIGADTLTEEKNLKRFQAATERLGLALEHALVPNAEGWIEAYRQAQSYDFVILGGYAGIENWAPERVFAEVIQSSRRLSVTNHRWMMSFALLGMTMVAEEHGEWAAKTALRLLEGMAPREIPIVANQRRDTWINEQVLASSGVRVPNQVIRKAKKVAPLETKS